MYQRWTFFAVLTLTTFLAAAAEAQDAAPPTMSIQIRSLDAVLENVKLLVKLSGREEIAKQVEGLIKNRIGANGLEGIDPNRPFGAYVRLGRDLNDIRGAGLAPIADQNAFLGLLENLNIKVARNAKTNIYNFAVEKDGEKLQVFFRFVGKYLYFTTLSVDSLDDKNLVPAAQVFAPAIKSTIGIALQLDQIPSLYKDLAIFQLRQTVQDEENKKVPGETPAQKALRVESARGLVEQFAAVLKDGKQLAVDLDLDKKSKEMSLSLSLGAVSKSKLAETIAQIGNTKSILAGVRSPDAAVQGSITLALPPNIRKLYASAIEEARATMLAEVQDPGKKKQVEALLKTLNPTLKAGEVDAAFTIVGPKGTAYSFLAALKLHEGAAFAATVNELLEEVAKQIPAEARDQLKLNAETVAGTKVHRFKFAFGPKEKELLGNSPLYLAIRDDAILFAGGPQGLALLKTALESATPTTVPPLRMEVSLSRLAPLFEGPNREKLMTLFEPGEGGTIRFSLEGGTSLRVRLTSHLSIVQVLDALSKKK